MKIFEIIIGNHNRKSDADTCQIVWVRTQLSIDDLRKDLLAKRLIVRPDAISELPDDFAHEFQLPEQMIPFYDKAAHILYGRVPAGQLHTVTGDEPPIKEAA